MAAVTAGHYWLRCRHCLRLQLPLPLSLIPCCCSRLQWICNDHARFWIRDEGRQVCYTAWMSGSDSNAGCTAGYNVTLWLCMWGPSEFWCDTTGCTQGGGLGIHWPLLCSGRCGSHGLSEIWKTRIVQRRWGAGVLGLYRRDYGTPSLRGIPLASRYGNASLRRWKWKIPWSHTRWLILMVSKPSNILYDRSRVR